MKLSSFLCTVYRQQPSVHNTLVIIGSSPESNSILWISALLILANCYVSHPLLIDPFPPDTLFHALVSNRSDFPSEILTPVGHTSSIGQIRSNSAAVTDTQCLPNYATPIHQNSKMIQSKSIISLWSHKISIKNAFASSRGNFLLWPNIIWKVSDN